MAEQPVLDTDRSPSGTPEQAQDEVAVRLQKAAAYYAQQRGSDLNIHVPAVEYDPVTKRRFFDTAPVPLKRLFGSPLVQKGRNATGPNQERRVSSGWGDPRSTAYDEHANLSTRHHALDFPADYGETIYAAADGKVTFVGFQHREKHGVDVDGAHENPDNGDIIDGKGNVVATVASKTIGFGGIFLYVVHSGDFQGYRTEYMHLSAVLVREGEKVLEGQPIAKVGGTGGYYGFFKKGLHLHFQVSFVSGSVAALVRPTAMVPNYWPGHQDSTNANAVAFLTMPPLAEVGQQIATAVAGSRIQALDRATAIQNQDPITIKRSQSTYADVVAARLNQQQSALYSAIAAFQGQSPVVAAPMTFDFTTGTWSDGKVV